MHAAKTRPSGLLVLLVLSLVLSPAALADAGERGFLGIGFSPLDEPDTKALRVLRVTTAGPAERAGVEVGDLIVSIDGEDIASIMAREVYNPFAQVEVGQEVRFGILRADDALEIAVTASASPIDLEAADDALDQARDYQRRQVGERLLDRLGDEGGQIELRRAATQQLEVVGGEWTADQRMALEAYLNGGAMGGIIGSGLEPGTVRVLAVSRSAENHLSFASISEGPADNG